MDDPGWQWPAWKFGMKREELFTKLHDQYNTIAFSIQDPEAFHHDVYEISNTASCADEFHRLLADRKQLRLNELNQSLESASVEIIANPDLIGTHQWQFAIQLFRTKSLDSLVRYFSSYLPDDHPWHQSTDDPTSKPFFDDPEDDGSLMTYEPFAINTAVTSIPESHLPPSPRSLTTCSDNSLSLTPARTMSFSEAETDVMVLSGTLSRGFDDEDISQSDVCESPTTSVSDMSEIQSLESLPEEFEEVDNVREEEKPTTTSFAQREDTNESEMPTPRNECRSDSYISDDIATAVSSSKQNTPHRSVRDGSPGLLRSRRRSPEVGRVRKPSPDPTRIRPKGRRRYLGGV
ncbi:uncharacterized protein GGS22DRAFT_172607 [Annulohypoxylon maeteangense]|uniref:uncharacterized protein n=1 Tax=Annulohypoxylon maeteangense TaxID=1927788 RepID=UPI002007C463|nr:uncharacterized protein GGS22DRAFT_172607 [Annulohypoxylon maeteangense]KAI0881632.1 hypothetical protein GGS22DRAFT_172607 [Annulohypoxylon maeteangense]